MAERTPLAEPISPRLASVRPGRARALIIVVSVVACAFLLFLVYGLDRGESTGSEGWWSAVPIVNAVLNTACAVSLVVGYRAIRRRAVDAHRRAMLVAVGFSAAFLLSYVTYHAFHGDTPFQGDPAVRAVYLVVLASHVVLSIVALPLVLGTLWASLSGRFATHRRVARVTLPIWLYVSVTGVLVVVMLRAFGM